MPEGKWLFEVAIIGMLEHTGVREVVETQAVPTLTAGDKEGVLE